MSVEAITTVLHHSRATGTAKVVLIGIANHAGDGGAWPTVATLAKYAGVTDRNVQIAIRKLVELGEIRVHVQAGGTRTTPERYRSNRYDILVSCPADCDRSTSHRCASDDVDEAPEDATDRGVDSDTPHAETGVSIPTPLTPVRGVDSDASGVSESTPEPSYNHPDTPQPPASGGPTSTTPICGRHPGGAGKNCRACGTTSKQLAEAARIERETAQRAAEQEQIRAERERNAQLRERGRPPELTALLDQTRKQLAKAGAR